MFNDVSQNKRPLLQTMAFRIFHAIFDFCKVYTKVLYVRTKLNADTIRQCHFIFDNICAKYFLAKLLEIT